MTKTRFTFLVLLLQFFAIAAFAQHDYFADIDGVKGGADMKNALYNIIKEHKRISYGKGEDKTWGAFYTTDAVVENVVYSTCIQTRKDILETKEVLLEA